jgi:hypothetical protein
MSGKVCHPPPRDEVKAVLVRKFAATLWVALAPGELTAKERRTVASLNRRFVSSRWLRQKGGLTRPGITIGAGVRVAEAEHKAAGGLIRVTARLKDDTIDDVPLSGDFTFHPAPLLGHLETALRGHRLDRHELTSVVREFHSSSGVQAPGVEPADFAAALLKLGEVAGLIP